MLTPKYSTQLNPYYLCRMPRSGKARRADGRQTCIVFALTLAFLCALGWVVEHLPTPVPTATAGVYRPYGFTADTK